LTSTTVRSRDVKSDKEGVMRPGRVFSLIVGCLLLLPGVAMVAGGGMMGVGYAVARNDDGYFEIGLDRLQTPTVAIRSEEVDFFADPGSPNWLVDALDVGLQVDARAVDADTEVFVGVADRRDLDAYLAGSAHDEVVELRDGRVPRYLRHQGGAEPVAPPTDQEFWVASAVGESATLAWDIDAGTWAIVVMNADGARGVAADVDVGVRSDAFLPVAFTLLGLGVLATALAVTLIVLGVRRDDTSGPTGTSTAPSAVAGIGDPIATHEHPVALSATLDPHLSRWMWLVKWFLAIPHFVVLVFLWIAFFTLTAIAGFAILFTGRYPEGIWRFNLGVLRWSWRVSYYAGSGGIGTDHYPPFSLGREPQYPAVLDIAYPEHLSRGLVLVKWWLLAIPHYVIVAVLVGGIFGWSGDGWRVEVFGGGGLLGLLTIVAGVILLVTGRYPQSLFDLIVGFNRWVYRVIAYAALMTDRYPPFRLDQGGREPFAPLPPPPYGIDEPARSRDDAR
jgi:hypothetical protein